VTWSRVKPRQQVHGSAHAKARKQWAAQHDPSHLCVRCGHALGPMGPGLHLDHHDYDKTVYRGFSHGRPCPTCRVACNVVAGAALGRARQKARRRGPQPPTALPM
jgi:hypothetical protein